MDELLTQAVMKIRYESAKRLAMNPNSIPEIKKWAAYWIGKAYQSENQELAEEIKRLADTVINDIQDKAATT